MTSAIKACAEILSGATTWKNVAARCNLARCGATGCGEIYRDGVYAGMLPIRLDSTSTITAALTELPGAPADPRQAYNTAYDNPSMTLHIVGDDLLRMDMLAQTIIEKYDRKSHIETSFGTVNGIRIAPPRREVRKERPRYDLQLTIDMEMIR